MPGLARAIRSASIHVKVMYDFLGEPVKDSIGHRPWASLNDVRSAASKVALTVRLSLRFKRRCGVVFGAILVGKVKAERVTQFSSPYFSRSPASAQSRNRSAQARLPHFGDPKSDHLICLGLSSSLMSAE